MSWVASCRIYRYPLYPTLMNPTGTTDFAHCLVLICNFVVTKTSPSCGKNRKIAKGALQIKKVFAIGTLVATSTPFPGSSAVEQPAVNRLVAGSNPARGANSFKGLADHRLAPFSFRATFRATITALPRSLPCVTLIEIGVC